MTIRIIIPVKSLEFGKSRLAGKMPVSDRAILNESLLINTLEVAREVISPENIIVVSRDEKVLAIARQKGMQALLEIGEGGLNNALYQVNNTLDKERDSVLILPTDLPLMTGGDIQRLIQFSEKGPIVVVVPDRHELGTNALLVSPVGSIPYRFGDHSCNRHILSAKKRGIPVETCSLPNLMLDLDEKEDLEILKSRGFIISLTAIKPMKETVL